MFEDWLWFSSSYIGKREFIPEIAITSERRLSHFFGRQRSLFPANETMHRDFLWISRP